MPENKLIFDDESTPMITPSEVREIHERRETENIKYLRKKLGCMKKENSIYIASKEIGNMLRDSLN